jgi:hypothetical protein
MNLSEKLIGTELFGLIPIDFSDRFTKN